MAFDAEVRKYTCATSKAREETSSLYLSFNLQHFPPRIENLSQRDWDYSNKKKEQKRNMKRNRKEKMNRKRTRNVGHTLRRRSQFDIQQPISSIGNGNK